MSLVGDKIKPKYFEEFIINRKLALKLKKYASAKDFLNILIYGGNGYGKYTLSLALLNEFYGKDIYKRKSTNFKIKIGTNIKSIDVVHSNYHYEIFINHYLFNDKATLLMLIKSIIGNYNVKTNSYNIILLKSIDYINDNIIKLFKSLMEVYIDTCRFIFICKNNSKLSILKSNILYINIPKPEKSDIIKCLKDNSIEFDKNIIKNEYNLNKLWCIINSNIYGINSEKMLNEKYLDKFITILNTPGLKTIDKLKTHLYDYICKNFNKVLIYHTIIDYYIYNSKISNLVKGKIIELSATFQHRQAISYREIIHLEAYLINIFNVIHPS